MARCALGIRINRYATHSRRRLPFQLGLVHQPLGAVAGISSSTTGGWNSSTSRATCWPADPTSPTDLAPLGSTASYATSVNDHAEVVGITNSMALQRFWRQPVQMHVTLRKGYRATRRLEFALGRLVKMEIQFFKKSDAFTQGQTTISTLLSPRLITPIMVFGTLRMRSSSFRTFQFTSFATFRSSS